MRIRRRKRTEPPIVSERPPGPQRRFRKTAEELAVEFLAKLTALGVESTQEEVVTIVRGQAPKGLVATLVEAWVSDEIARGVSIV